MARNEEKQLGKLNRLFLHKEREEYYKKHPKRPKLSSLNTIEEIQEWIPNIKEDLEFYLSECQVSCYPEHKIVESQQKVLRLEKEFKAFVRKIRVLSPGGLDVVPWTCRPYKSKNQDLVQLPNKKVRSFVPIATPLLETVHIMEENSYIVNTVPVSMDKPLEFNIENAKGKCVEKFCKGLKHQEANNLSIPNTTTSTDPRNVNNTSLELPCSLVQHSIYSLENNEQENASAILEKETSCKLNSHETISEGSNTQKAVICHNKKEIACRTKNDHLLNAISEEYYNSQSLLYSNKPVGSILGLDYDSTSGSD